MLLSMEAPGWGLRPASWAHWKPSPHCCEPWGLNPCQNLLLSCHRRTDGQMEVWMDGGCMGGHRPTMPYPQTTELKAFQWAWLPAAGVYMCLSVWTISLHFKIWRYSKGNVMEAAKLRPATSGFWILGNGQGFLKALLSHLEGSWFNKALSKLNK